MKLERINDNQIRCTLTRADLAERQIKISELAYGSDKAKALFQDMMTQAADELGFEADNIPLVIEAVPLSNESIVLIITKVEDPEELDTRFSKFTQPDGRDGSGDSFGIEFAGSDDIIDIFRRLRNSLLAQAASQDPGSGIAEEYPLSPDDNNGSVQDDQSVFRIYEFTSLDQVSALSEALPDDFTCSSTLYKNTANSKYYLVLCNEDPNVSDFGQICCLASEYGTAVPGSVNTLFYYDEHYDTIIAADALRILRSL